ncbi:hypothetical protein BSL78_10088 [Apostichopus japonicus]|uniref:Uncharacterized protein n=1 Tax=Stichopus japonicus TaxID=307972 RepID=A0A2G8KYE8_STIJA|nr:hypothetical protein BSL78_10088 [Apostichopus japonicus]
MAQLKHTSYVTMLASTETGTYGLGLGELLTETVDALLHEAIEAMTELLSLENVDAEETPPQGKNTMTDRCVVNKKFVQLLEEWREVLQETTNWDELSEEVKDAMTTINDFYCGKHLVLNLQDFVGAALKEWEQVESTTGKLGREKHLPWSRKSESATFLAIRAVCEAYGPDASAQAGSPNELTGYLDEIGE